MRSGHRHRQAVGGALLLLMLAGCGPPAPIGGARSRPVALGFGMYVTPDPERNPIDPPERFAGYHTGIDYELLGNELDAVIPVFAICSGSVLYSGYVEGYGGVVVHRCKIDNEIVTVLYGHLTLEELPPEDTVVMPGDRIGMLAAARSQWSDGNRKHLHLGIHRGEALDLRGYVQSPDELKEFIDPHDILPPGAAGRPVQEYHIASER